MVGGGFGWWWMVMGLFQLVAGGKRYFLGGG